MSAFRGFSTRQHRSPAAMSLLSLLSLSFIGLSRSFSLPRSSAESPKVKVRFQNFALGEPDLLVDCDPGSILMDVGDASGVKIPRGCKTGVCGTCTVDLMDPNFDGQLQTVRACCTVLQQNEAGGEVVVDCSRMLASESELEINPMARFSDDWEKEFKPDYRQSPSDNEALYTSTGMGARAEKREAVEPEKPPVQVEINGGSGGILGAAPRQEEPAFVPEEPEKRAPPADPRARWRSAINGSPKSLPAAEKTAQREVAFEPLLRPSGVTEGAKGEDFVEAGGGIRDDDVAADLGSEMVRSSKPRPRLITFDATGTLMQLRSHLGVVYREALLSHAGILRLPRPDVFSTAWNKAYAAQLASMPCFGCGSGIDSFEWWRPVMQGTYDSVFDEFNISDEEVADAGGMESKQEVMEMVFQDLYFNIFAKGPPEGMWELRPGVEAVLRSLRSAETCVGLKLGVLSNFDDRLQGILESLGIAQYFDFVLTSRDAGQEKPSQVMFDLARNALVLEGGVVTPMETRECLHVGDTLGTDVRGALDAGWQSAYISDIATVLRNEAHPQEGMPQRDEYLLMGDLYPILELFALDVSQRDHEATSVLMEAIHPTTDLER